MSVFKPLTEELWPCRNAAASRSSLRGLEHRAARSVAALKHEVRGWRAAIDEHLSGA